MFIASRIKYHCAPAERNVLGGLHSAPDGAEILLASHGYKHFAPLEQTQLARAVGVEGEQFLVVRDGGPLVQTIVSNQ